MIEQQRADRREGSQIVFVGGVVAVPGDDVERRMADLGDMELAAPFHEHPARRFLLLIGRGRSLEIAGIGEAVRADRSALRQREFGPVVLADIAGGGTLNRIDLEFHAARHNRDFA